MNDKTIDDLFQAAFASGLAVGKLNSEYQTSGEKYEPNAEKQQLKSIFEAVLDEALWGNIPVDERDAFDYKEMKVAEQNGGGWVADMLMGKKELRQEVRQRQAQVMGRLFGEEAHGLSHNEDA